MHLEMDRGIVYALKILLRSLTHVRWIADDPHKSFHWDTDEITHTIALPSHHHK